MDDEIFFFLKNFVVVFLLENVLVRSVFSGVKPFLEELRELGYIYDFFTPCWFGDGFYVVAIRAFDIGIFKISFVHTFGFDGWDNVID